VKVGQVTKGNKCIGFGMSLSHRFVSNLTPHANPSRAFPRKAAGVGGKEARQATGNEGPDQGIGSEHMEIFK